MASRAEIDRLRLEADTIMTRYQQVEQALAQARSESGEHWETGELTVTLDTPRGEPIDVTLDLDADPASNAQSRYERAKALEAELERKQEIVGQLAPLPVDPVAYLICYHLDAVEGNWERSNNDVSRPSRPTRSASTTPTTGSHGRATVSCGFSASVRDN